MADDERKALVVQGPRSLAQVGAGARKILSSVVSDALAVASSREKALAGARFQIAGYEFREPDCSQILTWARALEIDPVALVNTLEKTCFTYRGFPKVVFAVEQGAIVSLAWDVIALPLENFDCVTGLKIRELAVFGKGEEHIDISLQLPSLRLLIAKSVNLTTFDLSKVPSLTELHCANNQLTELDLCNMPNLTKLSCGDNKLTELDLSGLSELTTLWCCDNKLTELDLTNVPKLRNLCCDGTLMIDECNRPTYEGNRLTELDLSNVPNLTTLSCDENQLTELDLSKMPNLTTLYCRDNQLTELDLSNVPDLTTLQCDGNQLTELNLSSVPHLTTLYCIANQISELDLSVVPNLTKLDCKKNLITELDVTANTALTELHCDGSVRVVKLLRRQNFKRYPPMRYFFDEVNNTLFQMAVPPPDLAGITEIREADYEEYVGFVAAEVAKATAIRDHDDE